MSVIPATKSPTARCLAIGSAISCLPPRLQIHFLGILSEMVEKLAKDALRLGHFSNDGRVLVDLREEKAPQIRDIRAIFSEN